jgi:predicted transcriptional regulator
VCYVVTLSGILDPVGDPVALTRTNVTLPAELLREVDELAGPRGRSQFVAEAIVAKVKRERLRKALDASRGVFVGTPWHMTPDESYRWVRSMREDEEKE